MTVQYPKVQQGINHITKIGRSENLSHLAVAHFTTKYRQQLYFFLSNVLNHLLTMHQLDCYDSTIAQFFVTRYKHGNASAQCATSLNPSPEDAIKN